MSTLKPLKIDIVSDVVCPWCYIGKRRIENALALVPDVPVEVRWRPFFLNSWVPREGISRDEYLTAKFGSVEAYKGIAGRVVAAAGEEGLTYHPELVKRQPNTTDCHRLIHWAERTPERVFMADRDPASGAWRRITYAETLAQVRAIGAALLQRNLSAERPIMILSGNDIEHALLGLAAMYVGVPSAPVSPAYSLVSQDFSKLRSIVDLLTPGLVFAADGEAYGRAIAAVVRNNNTSAPSANDTSAMT